MRSLEIGGGPHPAHPEYEQFDAIDWSARTGLAYMIGHARKLPYDDGTFHHVYASNLLEHFPEDETTAILTEWARVVVPGGTLEIIVPDSMGILRDHFTGVNSWTDCAERLRGSMDYPGNEHFRAFTLSSFEATVLARVPGLETIFCVSSHAGGGIHCVSLKSV